MLDRIIRFGVPLLLRLLPGQLAAVVIHVLMLDRIIRFGVPLLLRFLLILLPGQLAAAVVHVLIPDRIIQLGVPLLLRLLPGQIAAVVVHVLMLDRIIRLGVPLLLRLLLILLPGSRPVLLLRRGLLPPLAALLGGQVACVPPGLVLDVGLKPYLLLGSAAAVLVLLLRRELSPGLIPLLQLRLVSLFPGLPAARSIRKVRPFHRLGDRHAALSDPRAAGAGHDPTGITPRRRRAAASAGSAPQLVHHILHRQAFLRLTLDIALRSAGAQAPVVVEGLSDGVGQG